MVGISATTPQTITTQSQTRIDPSNPQFRDNKKVSDRMDLTKTRGSELARAQASETRNYEDAEKLLAEQRQVDFDSNAPIGQRRGSTLDISV